MPNSVTIENHSFTSSLRVLHVIPSVAPCRGGPSKAVIDIVCALRKAGINAEIATTNDDGADKLDVALGELVQHKGVPVRFFNRISPPLDALREFGYSHQFTRWLKHAIKEYDLVHIHAIFSFCSSKAMQLARKNNIPYVVRPIGQLEHWAMEQSQTKKMRYLELVEKDNLEQASAVHFTASSEQKQALERFPTLRDVVIPLGLALPMEIRNARTKMEQRWKLQISSLEQLTDTLGLADRTKFVGFVRSAEKSILLQGADLYALTSHSENFGIAVLEAMASGTAVVVSRQVALAEQVSKHNLGFVTELEVADIQDKLELALTEIDQTREIGEHARDFVEQYYQWQRIARQLIKLYKKLLKSAT